MYLSISQRATPSQFHAAPWDIKDSLIIKLMKKVINKDYLPFAERAYIKKKWNGNVKIIKMVNSLLRNTVVVTYPPSTLNSDKKIEVHFKHYRENTVDKFGQTCREIEVVKYDLSEHSQCQKFIKKMELHMAVTPENSKIVNEALPVLVSGFDKIEEHTLYAMEIHACNIERSEHSDDKEDVFKSKLDLVLASDTMAMDFQIKVEDIVNFNNISDLVGKWMIFNYKGAFKIKNKEEMNAIYDVYPKGDTFSNKGALGAALTEETKNGH